MKPFLIADCYLDERGGAHNFERLLGGAPALGVRVARGAPLPTDPTSFRGVLVTGSAASVLARPRWARPLEAYLREAVAARVPVLGACFGHQALARALWGEAAVRASATPELGWIQVARSGVDPLFDGVGESFGAFASHSDEVAPESGDFDVLAASAECAVQAYRVRGVDAWGVQFHAEMERDEAESLVRERLAPPDAERVLAAATPAGDLGRRLVANFVCAAGADRGGSRP